VHRNFLVVLLMAFGFMAPVAAWATVSPPTETPTFTPTETPVPTATSVATVTAVPMPTPLFAANTLGVNVVAGPVPTKRGQPLCLFFATQPSSSSAELFELGGGLALKSSFGSQTQPCLATQALAPGIYLLRVKVDGKERWQKVAITP
jgi:hypothetical protein